MIVEIKNIDAPELAPYIQLRSRQTQAAGLFIAESAKVIACALDAGCVPVSLLMERRQIESEAGRRISERCADVPVYTAPRALLEGLTGYALTRGFLAAMRRPQPRDAAELLSGARRVAVLEHVTDATNVGAILRSAAALGMDALLLTPDCCDPLHRRALRVSMGTAFQLPWAYCGDVMGVLHGHGFRVAALALREDAVAITDPTLKNEAKLALLLGSEGEGLSEESIARADCCVRIPMAHGVDSLNVAAAAAVAMWELRAREQAPLTGEMV